MIPVTLTPSLGFNQGSVFPPMAQDAQLPPPSGKEAGKGSPHACSWQWHVPRPLVLSRGRMQEMGGGQAMPGERQSLNLQPGLPGLFNCSCTQRIVL